MSDNRNEDLEIGSLIKHYICWENLQRGWVNNLFITLLLLHYILFKLIYYIAVKVYEKI